MGGQCAILGPTDVQNSGFEIDPPPSQVHHLRRSQAMPVGQEQHQGVTVAVPVGLGRLNELIDLVGSQVLTGSQLGIRWARRRDCSIFSAWRDQPQVQSRHDLRAPRAATVQTIGIF
jgi:hypothetical protein